MSETSVQLFVYGTLRSGEQAHGLLEEARFVGPARTAPHFELLDLGEYPALVPRGTSAVVGELYEVSAALFNTLDAYEGCPELFNRAPIPLEGGGEAEAYVMAPERARSGRRIASGDWLAR